MAWHSVNELRPGHLLRKFTCATAPGAILLDMTGIPALTTTIVQTFHTQLLSYGLPFRVNVRGVGKVVTPNSDDEPSSWGFSLPPVSINPALLHGVNSWQAFVQLTTHQLTHVAQELPDTETSNFIWLGLEKLELTYVPQDNLAAFAAHMQHVSGGAARALPEILSKKGVLNIWNGDNQCLRCCLICWKIKPADNANYWGKYLTNMPRGGRCKPRGWKPVYVECGLDLTALPYDRAATLQDITAVERCNEGLGVYVYNWHNVEIEGVSQSFQVLCRAPQNQRRLKDEVHVLLYGGHFYLITNFQRFMSQQSFKVTRLSANNHHATHTCHRCLANHRTEETLAKHLNTCSGVWDVPERPARLPSHKRKGDKVLVTFEDYNHELLHPLVVYADIETFFQSANKQVSKSSRCYGENIAIASVGMHAVGADGLTIPAEFQAQIFALHGACDPFAEFLRRLIRLAMYWRYCRTYQQELRMTPEAKRAFASAKSCESCGKDFGPKVTKCRDHDHITGAYRSALCGSCNASAQIPNRIKVFSHNGTGFDHHFYIRNLARLRTSEQRGLFTFAGSPAEWASHAWDNFKLEDFSLEVMSESTEKFRAITLKKGDLCIEFLDSRKFLKDSLDHLIKSQKKCFADLSAAFPLMTLFHPMVHRGDNRVQENLELLLRKVPFPYRTMQNSEFFKLPALLDKEAYYDDLRQKPLDDKTYEDMKAIIQKLGVSDMREWHDLYLYTDVLALADCMEAFRHGFVRSTGLDPFHRLGLAGAAWSALLRNSGALIENISKECCQGGGNQLMKYVDANIRGGLACAFVPHAVARNPKCPNYEACHPSEHVWIKDFDANSLYPYCMSMPLPTGRYSLQGGIDAGQERTEALTLLATILQDYTPADARGYMLVVRLEIPERLHDFWDYAPAVNRHVAWGELSRRQQTIKCQKYLQGYKVEEKVRRLASLMTAPGQKKLVPDLNPQDRKAIHVEHAQELRKYGAVFTELYACYSFAQSRVFEEEIAKCAAARAAGTDELARNVEKLKMNSSYGKTLENKRGRRNVKVHTKVDTFQRQACYKRTREFDIQHYCEEDGSFLGVTTAKKKAGIVLDTPRMVGWAVLEYAKMVMTRFHYGTMKKLFPGALKLLYTDTDSMYYEIRWPTDPIDHIAQCGQDVFDLSLVERYHDTPLKGRLGCFKYEAADNKDGVPGMDNEIVEALFLAPKSYVKRMAIEKDGSTLKIAGKGVPGSVLHDKYGDTIDHFKDAVLKNRVSMATYNQFRSFSHVVRHCTVTKVALSAENDKVFQISPRESRPLGHWRNKGVEQTCPEWDLPWEDELMTAAKKLVESRRVPLAPPLEEEDGSELDDEEVDDEEVGEDED